MIAFTGDLHGDATPIIIYLENRRRKHMPDPEAVVILGDVGANYYFDGRDDRLKLTLDRLGVDILCVHGNHEARPETIESYNEDVYAGGLVMVEPEYPHLKFLLDGEEYIIGGKKTIVIGGAYSVDKEYRLEFGWQWFSDEQPSEQAKRKIERRLKKDGWKIDQVLSHTCPAKFTPTERFIPGIDQSKVDKSTEQWLNKIEDKLDYGRWLCGHWHCDKNVTDKFFILFETFLEDE